MLTAIAAPKAGTDKEVRARDRKRHVDMHAAGKDGAKWRALAVQFLFLFSDLRNGIVEAFLSQCPSQLVKEFFYKELLAKALHEVRVVKEDCDDRVIQCMHWALDMGKCLGDKAFFQAVQELRTQFRAELPSKIEAKIRSLELDIVSAKLREKDGYFALTEMIQKEHITLGKAALELMASKKKEAYDPAPGTDLSAHGWTLDLSKSQGKQQIWKKEAGGKMISITRYARK